MPHAPKPPFRNVTLDDFFGYRCKNQTKSNTLMEWILETFPDLNCTLMYQIPMFKLGKANICYMNYFRVEDGEEMELELELCFGKGLMMSDRHQLFTSKNKTFKSIHVGELDKKYLEKIKSYIEEVIKIS
jgi:hypothetical protein